MTKRTPGSKLMPLSDRTGEPDSPLGADMLDRYRSMTDALIYKMALATRSWVWPSYPLISMTYQSAPRAQISAVQTWTKFQFPSNGADMDFGMPWRFTEGAEKILLYIGLVSHSQVALRCRVDTQSLVDAAATATGEVSMPRIRPNHPPEMLGWEQMDCYGHGTWGFGTWYAWVTPTVPANRRIKLVPYVYAPDDNPVFRIGGKIEVNMVTMVAMDVPSRNDLGW